MRSFHLRAQKSAFFNYLFPVGVTQDISGGLTLSRVHLLRQALLQLTEDVMQELAFDLSRPRQTQNLQGLTLRHDCGKQAHDAR